MLLILKNQHEVCQLQFFLFALQFSLLDRLRVVMLHHKFSGCYLKDPFLYTNDAGDTILMFSIHPFNWASSNTGMAVRRKGEDEFGMISYDFFPRGFTWDVAISRMTGVFKVPRSGAFADLPQIYLLFWLCLAVYSSWPVLSKCPCHLFRNPYQKIPL